MNDTERIILVEGGWWEIKCALTRGDRRKVDAHVQVQAFQYVQQLKSLNVSMDELRKMAGNAPVVEGADSRPSSSPDEDDMLLVVGTVAWSFPEPISLESVSMRSESDANRILARMHVLYAAPSEATLKNFNGMPPSGPLVTAPSQAS